ncbi:beta-galactosidase [Patescibacteria group bacterium]|nr:beta-galactosidase [Patescibacteria group bacterium]MBU4022940.1 beta-galactosidase [Patescibacteria group bacterium]MBU4078286.1 beta-galactosidase [Patescibacteria group bacterium]
MLKFFKMIIFFILIILITIFCFLFVGKAKPAENINWGVIFSQKHSEEMGLDWKENYLAILDDLGVEHLKLIAYWDMVEPNNGEFDFSDLDFQIQEAEKRNAKVMLVMGRKVPRWPECHIPEWAMDLESHQLDKAVLDYLEAVVLRYRDSSAITMWQVENEPFFLFGYNCPLIPEETLKMEIDLVKSLDNKQRPIVVSESGEFPTWFKAAKYADIVGHTLYRVVWSSELKFYFKPPIPAVFYHRKAWLIDKVFNKKVICVELQAEPWSQVLLYDSTLEEQRKTMDLDKFKNVIEYAKNTGEDTFYLWGVEWWYWMKIKHNSGEIWQEAKKLW